MVEVDFEERVPVFLTNTTEWAPSTVCEPHCCRWAIEMPVNDSIFDGIRAVVSAVHACKPRARIVLETLLPTNDAGKNKATVRPVNERIRGLVSEAPFSGYVTVLDLYPSFVDASGAQIGSLFNDGLHPSQEGYARWRDRLVPLVESLRSLKP